MAIPSQAAYSSLRTPMAKRAAKTETVQDTKPKALSIWPFLVY